MRKIGLLAATALLVTVPAFAQGQYQGQYAPAPQYAPTPQYQAPQYAPAPAPMPQAERVPAPRPGRAPSTYESQRTGESRTGRSPGGPIDVGPRTPQANAAFMGGGAILEGPPGAPAPEPSAITVQPGPDGVVRNYMTIQTR
ncbi:hypothetical protein GXW71_26145 [Roseomonas hellenica]|uniref:Uncharacterized protein n=1 Tax=Plastoroseomonas hellenica TaxID=2687306 RepID=A0ABS5F5K9_9PROT|nr:hypothetical protein [Plastoroseomonas hellenica]MBR0667863.1 hypothetical protein [Plastoroseomonas hellenica]